MKIKLELSDAQFKFIAKLVETFVDTIEEGFSSLNNKIDSIMTKQEQFKADVMAEFKRVDDATNEIAKDFKDYADKIEAQGISAIDEGEILNLLRSKADTLTQVGKGGLNAEVPAPAEEPTTGGGETPSTGGETPATPETPAEGGETPAEGGSTPAEETPA
jgi:hypothetical protein